MNTRLHRSPQPEAILVDELSDTTGGRALCLSLHFNRNLPSGARVRCDQSMHLFHMMERVQQMEFPPLADRNRSQNDMIRDLYLRAKALFTGRQILVHLFQTGLDGIERLNSADSRRHNLLWSLASAGNVAEIHYHHARDPISEVRRGRQWLGGNQTLRHHP